MLSTAKKDLILDGLDCANCSTKIEYEVNKIDGVVATMNFITKTLSIEIENDQNIENVLRDISAIIYKYEPHVVVKEKVAKEYKKKTLLLYGLGCANCATKIEINVNNLAGVKSANVNFISKKLIIELENIRDFNEILKETESIVKRIEPEVEILDADEHKKAEGHHGEHNNKKELVKIGIGGFLFAIGLIFNLPNWLSLSIFITSYIIVGGEIVLNAMKNVLKGQIFDENFLMTTATIGAFLIGEYPEAVAVMLFYNIGEFFQDMAVDRSRKSISELMDIRPDYANLRVGSEIKQVTPEEVSIGDIIVIKPGEKVPLDGIVIEGHSTIDTSALTGESAPREVNPNSDVLSGSININGVITVEVTREFRESTVSKILDLVQNASSKKAPTENFITKFARYYTPIVVIIATLIAFLPPILVTGATFSDWVYRALVFLVISCPCALVVSIPLGFFGGIGRASKSGILVKGSNYLEALNSVETVIFDKTGTLTKGVFTVTEIQSINNYTKDELLKYAAYAESLSNHPIATSILKSYKLKVDNNKIENYEEIPGYGVKVRFEGKDIIAGNSKLMKRENITHSHVESIGTVVHISVNKAYAGYILISDEIKEDSIEAIKSLKSIGVKKTIMLTGDLKVVGDNVGRSIGINEVYSELLPTDKVEKLEFIDKQKSPNKKLIFVGDGINDAPVLARADIGIAMGGLGSDAAIEAADIVIMTDEPSKIPTAIKIAKRTRRIVWQNIILSMGVKLVFLILGAFGVATLWEAVFADVGVALLAVLNAMRVMKEEIL